MNGHHGAPEAILTEPSTDRSHWVFAATPISWRRWVVTWELDQLDGFSQHDVLDNVALLPG